MKPEHLSRQPHEQKRVPLWKWVVVLFLVVAMPLFFAFYRKVQLQQVLNQPVQTPVKPPAVNLPH